MHYAETSMKNGFGLKYIHKFLNLPFLLLQVCILWKNFTWPDPGVRLISVNGAMVAADRGRERFGRT